MAQLGPYDIDEPLGHGAVGRVFGGVHRATGTRVAAKLARGDVPRSSALTSLLQELELIARFDHPGIVAVLDGGYLEDRLEIEDNSFEPGTPYIVVERADGTLRDHEIASWPELRELLITLLEALGYAHARHVVHRDMKPENVLRVNGQWKLGDFGLGGIYTNRQASPNAGSPQFMAPEQFRGAARDLLPSTDLYGVGGIAYWIVSGRAPFEASNYLDYAQAHLEQTVPPLQPIFDVPEGLELWIRRLLDKSQVNRFFRAADAIWALRNLDEPSMWNDTGSATLLIAPRRPFPATWRRELVPRTDELVAASLSLFGMREPPLVGRDTERDQLWSALQRVRETGRARVMVLEGSAGCGKSRLAEWLCHRADEHGVGTYMTGFADPDRGGASMLMDMTARYLRSMELAPNEARDRARQLFEVYGIAPDWRLEALERLLLETARDEEELELGAEERYGLLWTLIRSVSSGRPVVVHIDDAHHSVAALELLHRVFEDGAAQANVLFVLTVQRDAVVQDPTAHALLNELYQLPTTTRLLLADLSTPEVRTLLRELLRLERGLAERLAERVSGNPLFAVQLVTHWVALDALSYEGGQLHLDRRVWPTLPDSISDVWRDRLHRAVGPITASTQKALELAAVLGREVVVEDWIAICRDAEVDPPDRLLEALFASGLARGENRGWTFVHPMLRETLLRTCREGADWVDAHLAVGNFILTKSAILPMHERIGRAARHFAEAHDERTADLFNDAIERAQHFGDHHFALELIRQFDDLDDELVSVTARHRSTLLAVTSLIRVGQAPRGLEMVQDVIAAAQEHSLVGVEAEAHQVCSHVYRVVGQLHDAANSAKLAVETFSRAQDVDGVARATLELADVYGYMSRHREATELYREARRHFAERQQRKLLAQTDYGLGYCLQQRGELDAAEPYLLQSYEFFRELGAQNDAYSVLISLGDLSRERGALELAEERYRACGEFFEATGDIAGMVIYLNLAMVALAREDYEAMRGWTEYGRELAERHRMESLRAGIHALSLVCDAAERDWRAWDEDFAALPAWVAETGALERDDVLVVEAAAALTARVGDRGRAARAFDLLARLSERAGDSARARDAAARAAELRA